MSRETAHGVSGSPTSDTRFTSRFRLLADLAPGSSLWGRAGVLARRRPELLALGVLLILGLAARIYFTLVWRPAITGYSDSGIYFQDAYQGIWSDPIRTVGYGMFLTVLHAITPRLLFVIVVQHLMGLGVAVLLFLTVRRIGGPRWLGLVPAAIVALGGDELFIEHAALSETVYILLVSLMLYCAVRAAADGRLVWAAAAGLCAGLGVWDRGAAISLLPIAPLWLLFSRRRPTRRTVAMGALSLVVALGSVGGYVEWRQLASGAAASRRTETGTSTVASPRGPTARSSRRRPGLSNCVTHSHHPVVSGATPSGTSTVPTPRLSDCSARRIKSLRTATPCRDCGSSRFRRSPDSRWTTSTPCGRTRCD